MEIWFMNMVRRSLYKCIQSEKVLSPCQLQKSIELNYSSQLLYTVTLLIRQWCETFHHHDNMRYTGTACPGQAPMSARNSSAKL